MLVAGLVTAGLVACSNPTPYPQTISGVLLQTPGGRPAESVRVRFISSTQSADCETQGLDGVTDSEGRFQLSHLYQPSPIEAAVVVVHQYRLCISTGSRWEKLWAERIGPAPEVLEFECFIGRWGIDSAPCQVWHHRAT